MKIVMISDTHGQHHGLTMSDHPGDCLVHAGDWTGGSDLGFSETRDFLEWFAEQPYKHLICIAGNHERQVEASPKSLQIILNEFPNITYLNNSSCLLGTLKVFGSPYSNEFFNWAFMRDDEGLSEIWEGIPEDTDILITHGPAYKCNDKVVRSYGDPHVGSQSLANRKLELTNLILHVSGHIHEAYGMDLGTKVTSVCASVLNEKYKLVNEPITVSMQ